MNDESGPANVPPDPESTWTEPHPDRRSDRIGPYRILEKIGEGGMGVVYVAEQTEPVRRRVALKVIKHGMDTKQVIARFEAERQALALMDHSAIARIFDAGSTPDGRPYFVMELVKGVPISEHCDRNKLTNRERLDLFLQVCEGVQHAHQKGVIHRDLKPSNVLVSVQEGRPLVKIIDFGVAKAVSERLTERTLYTELGVMIGTPEYMSPEQAERTGQDVDARTDVYSLGVMLYELLVGALPFEPKKLRRAGFDEIRRMIREEDPPKPSARVSTLGDRSTESARRRRTEPRALRRELRGDLDWITMRALEKDRTRRYPSPAALAEDLGRYLREEPVSAHAPSAWSHLRRLARKHARAIAASRRALLYSTFLLLVATLLLNLALGALGRSAWAEAKTRFEREVGPLILQPYHRNKIVPPERNAATWIRVGARASMIPPEQPPPRAQTLPASRWTDEEIAEVRRDLPGKVAGLAMMAKAEDLPDSNWEVLGLRDELLVRQFPGKDILCAANWASARARLALSENRVDDALDDVELLGAIARSLEQEPAFLVLLSGTTLERMQIGLIQELVAREDLGGPALARLEATTTRGVDLRVALKAAYTCDSVVLAETLRREAGALADAGDTRLPAWTMVRGLRAIAAARFLDARAEFAAALDGNAREIAEAAARVDEAAGSGPASWILRPKIRDIDGMAERVSHTVSLRRLARLSVGLRRRAIEAGRYPATLAGLPDAEGPDPFTGSGLDYEVHGDGSARLEAPGRLDIYDELQWPALGRADPSWTLPAPTRDAAR